MRYTSIYLVALTFGFSSPLFATTNKSCGENLRAALAKDPKKLEATLQELLAESSFFTKREDTLRIYRELIQSDPKVQELLPEVLVLEVLADPSATYAPKLLDELFEHLSSLSDSTALKTKLKQSFEKILEDRVPKSSIAKRIDDFLKEATPAKFARVLGDMDFNETQELYHGGTPLKPGADSLIGRFISESGASTLVRSFPITPGGNEMGPKRLVVAVSENSFPLYEKYFTRHDALSVIGHAYVVHNGQLRSYNHYRDTDLFRLPSAGQVLPTVLLKTSEADRTSQYLRVMTSMQNGQSNYNSQAMIPWAIGGYCSERGAYPNCTHWIGNMPIGDKLVNEFIFPGPGDRPVIAKLTPHNSEDPLLQRIFSAPAHEQFSAVIGQADANGRGEFASPGWVIQTLLGPTSQERVPVVFLSTQDHTVPIPKDFAPQFEGPR